MDITLPTKLRYCEQHGIPFVQHCGSLDPDRHPSWSKLLQVRKLLDDYEWVWWMDADAEFLRYDVPPAWYMPADVDMTICADWPWLFEPSWCQCPYNMGVFLVRRSPWTLTLLDRLIQFPPDFLDVRVWTFWEQGALAVLSEADPHFAEHLNIVPHGMLNERVQDAQPDTVLLHAAGIKPAGFRNAWLTWLRDNQHRAFTADGELIIGE